MYSTFLDLAPQRIFCIGRNYVAHAKELDNPLPEEPMVFMKPASALVLPTGEPLYRPAHGDLHHEVEVVVLVGRAGVVNDLSMARSFIAGLGLGLDLTLRDVQKKLRAEEFPWEKAKSFDCSAPIGPMVPLTDEMDLHNLDLRCSIDGQMKQEGNTQHMIFSIEQLLVHLSQIWRLLPGDLIYTGTPAGVGPLREGETILIESSWAKSASWCVQPVRG